MSRKSIITALVVLLAMHGAFGQEWNRIPGGDVINTTEYVGARAGSTVPLLLKTIPDLRIDFSTSNTHRMGLNPSIGYAIGAFATAPRYGFLGISGRPGFWTAAPGPFTRLHLADDEGADDPAVYAQSYGYRSWMRNGITLTGNGDQAYMGQKYDGSDRSDLVFQWSDNSGDDPGYAPDRARFLFTSSYTGASTGSGSLTGLEALRLWPKSSTEVHMGIGDFAPAAVGEPTERVDVLDGRVRIRQLPDDREAEGPYKVVVVDDTPLPSGERGVLKWKDLSSILTDCDWTVQANNNVSTAYPVNPGCPQIQNGVGIGVD
jgi:hypothetical protein